MKPTHIEHIGIAVKSLEEAIPFYENVLGLKCYAVEEVKDAAVKEVEPKSEKAVEADIKEVAAAAKETVKDTGR